MSQYFLVIAEDKPGCAELRQKTRAAHLAYISGLGAAIKLGGPFLSPEATPAGSMIILEAADRAEAERLMAADPYALAGLFATVTIRPWVAVLGAWAPEA